MMKIARHCTALQIVRLGRCYKVTDASVMKVAAHCPLLQTISLNGCRQISDTSVLHLARYVGPVGCLLLLLLPLGRSAALAYPQHCARAGRASTSSSWASTAPTR
jgi:hypothetical protein